MTRFNGSRGVALGLALAASAAAQIPDTLSIQGRLTDDLGAPITDPVSLTVRIHDALTGGSVNFTETDPVIPTSDGVFATVIGDGASLDPSLFEAPRWVSFEVDGGGELAPRRPLLPAPAALRAQAAATLVPSAPLDMGSFRITGLATPVAPGDAVTKAYVDAHAGDGSVHFTQAAISVTAAQVSDFDAGVTASTHAGRTDNPHAVTKAQVGLGEVSNLKSNYSASSPPTPDDDTGDGYGVGSRWVDQQSGTGYTMTRDGGAGAAAWEADTTSRYTVRVSPVVVGGVVDAAASGDALEAALAGITDASSSRPYQVLLEPGRYELSGPLQLEGYVGIRGAGNRASVLEAPSTIHADYPTTLEDLSIEFSGATTEVIHIDGGSELTMRRVVMDGSIDKAAGRAIFVDGGLNMEECLLQMAVSGAGGGTLHGIEIGAASVRLDRTDLVAFGGASTNLVQNSAGTLVVRDGRIQSFVSTGFTRGIRAESGATRIDVQGTEILVVVSASGAYGIDSLAPETRVVDSSVEVSGASSDYGIRVFDATTGSRAMVIGNRVRVTAGSATSDGLDVAADDVLVNSNQVHVTGGTFNMTGITAVSSSGDCVVSGNQVRAESTLGGDLTGISAGNDAMVSGNRVRVARTVSSTGTNIGIRFFNGNGTASGNLVDVENSGDQTRGIQFGEVISALELDVSGVTDTIGIETSTLAMALSSVHATVSASAPLVIGVRVPTGFDFHASGLNLRVANTSAEVTDFAIGLDVDSSVGNQAVVHGGWIWVSAVGGTAYVADTVDAAGTPDLRIIGGRITADAKGSDVTCDLTTCP